MMTKSDDCEAGVRFVNYEHDYKQLLEKVFVISKIIKVDVEVITLTETLTFLDITKTESYYCFIIH